MADVLGHREFFLLEPVPFVEVQNGEEGWEVYSDLGKRIWCLKKDFDSSI